MIAPNNEMPPEQDESVGVGGRVRNESGRTPIQDGRMLSTAIRKGWLGDQRWATETTAERIKEAIADRGQEKLTAKQMAVAAVMADMAGPCARARQIAVKNLVAMEKQNQSDQQHADPQPVNHNHLHIRLTEDQRRQHIEAILSEALGHEPAELDGERNGHSINGHVADEVGGNERRAVNGAQPPAAGHTNGHTPTDTNGTTG